MSRPREDRYEYRELLGEGGSGRVWLVEDRLAPGVPLALKELAASASRGDEQATALRKEFATLVSLRHPGLVEVHEFETPANAPPRFTLELIEGRNIVEAVAREGASALADLVAEALRTLAFLHDFELLHRDLKPGNLLVRDRPKLGCRLVVLDFGLARAEGDPSEAPGAKGTLPYLAPELFQNASASRRSDLYALGVVVHEAVHGRPPVPFDGRDVAGFIRAVTEGRRTRPAPPSGFPTQLAIWLDQVLAPAPEARPATAREALARWSEAWGTQYPAETPSTRAARLLSGPPAERERTIEELWRWLDPSRGPRVVLLHGPSGSGKSRLLRWLVADGTRRGWHVVALHRETELSLPALRDRAAAGPTLGVLDDLDSADAATLAWVDRAAREPGAPALQLVAGVRAGGRREPILDKLLADAGTVPTVARIDLGPLDEAGVRAMASRATGGRVSDQRVRWLWKAAEGTPAIVETLLVEGAWERGGREAKPRDEVPRARLSLLSPGAGNWFDALCVLREDARPERIAELAGLEVEPARLAGEEVAALALAHRAAGRWHPESHRLVEQRLRGMEPSRRLELHRRALAILARTENVDPWLLSRVCAGAGERDRAVSCAVASAAHSAERGDPARAAARYGQAVTLLGRGRSGRHGLRMAQGRALVRCGQHSAAARAFGGAARFAATAEERAEALACRAEALVQAGRFRLGLEAARRAEAEYPASSARSEAEKAAGIALARLGQERDALQVLERARARLVAREGRDPAAEAELLQLLATCKLRSGDDTGAERDFQRVIELHRRGSGRLAPQEVMKARIGLAVLRTRRREFDEAREILEQVRKEAADTGQLRLQEESLSKLARVALERGALDEAERLAEQASDLALHLGDPNLVLVDHCRRADAWIRGGRPGEALALVRETLERPLGRVEPQNVDYARMLLADAWMESAGADSAGLRTLLLETLTRCRERRQPRALLMALALEMKRRAAPGCVEPFAPIAEELEAALARADGGIDPEIPIRAALARAAHSLGRGDAAGAAEAASRATEIAGAAGMPAFEAEARALGAEAAHRLGQEERAGQLRAEGRRQLQAAGERIAAGPLREAFLARTPFAALRERGAIDGRTHHGRLLALYDMIRVLNSETNAESLLESTLDMALGVVGAERGMVLLREEPGTGFRVHLARNLDPETVADATSYSGHVVAEAGAGRSLLTADAEHDERFRDLRSVSLYGIRSLMCVPLRSRGRIIGAVYLDSRSGGALFTQDDLRFLEAFADHAALALENVLERTRLERQNRRLQSAAETRTSFANIVGRSAGMQRVFGLIEKVAPTALPVLIHGESGTGKELVAHAIHFHGPRRRQPLVLENCSAVPASLLETELFGHVRGAFTGAERDHPGLFEQADHGTLFLDEVGDMSPEMQARLLRVLETGEIRRVGGEKPIRVDVRILAATHRDLEREAKEGRFREDLLYRLQVVTVEVPPLRERPDDVAPLVAHFLAKIGAERGRDPVSIEPAVVELFERYAWPGNVRQLQNTLQRLTLQSGGAPISMGLVESEPRLRAALLSRGAVSPLSLRQAERDQLRLALDRAGGNRGQAARLLNVSRATLYRKLKQHSL